jgi:hypothetical protein
VAKVKVVNTRLDSNLNGVNFNNIPSETIFSFGSFTVTSNFDGRKPIDYTNELSSFVRPVTLETMGVSEIESQILYSNTVNAVLNLDKSNLNTFVRYGSAYEFLRITIETIILNYPGSIFVDSQKTRVSTITFSGFTYDPVSNVSTFKVPTGSTVNTFGLITNDGNQTIPENNELRNLNLSFNKYIIWSETNSTGDTYNIIGYTGNTKNRKYLTIKTTGNPFPSLLAGATSGGINFHIKPNNEVFEQFRALLSDYQKYIVSQRTGNSGFKFIMKVPTLLENGSIIYSDSEILWVTGDGYNIDISTPGYRKFLEIVLTIGNKYDTIKTDLIARFLTPASLKTYDLTEEGKMTKLLRVYGREFDELRQFIDSLVNINKVTYNKINNIPDQLIKNLAKTFGWDYFSLINENELVESLFTIDDKERNLSTDLMPAEIDVELWRRILINTNYFWKTKGTREAIKSMFLLIGIPEPFINITEYVYTVDGKINPNTVTLSQLDFPTNSLPYDNSGYPIAPLETPQFYFQVSGNTDSGQAYMDVFRMAGFNLKRVVDNKKSWILTGETVRVDDTTPQYFQADSKLVLNTKEVDVALDTARGIEYDVFNYIKYQDFVANSSGYTLPYSYVNISLGVDAVQNTFPLPATYASDKVLGDLEVRYNGILLNAPKTGTTTGITFQADYVIDEVSKTFTLTNSMSAYSNTYRRDVIQATFVYSGGTQPISGITVQYIVTRVKANLAGTVIPLPSYPRGDVQVTINGVALTKGTPQFAADYILDPANTTGSSRIIISNPDVIAYLNVYPDVQVAYVEVVGSDDISARSEIVRVDSFNSGKVYYNPSANKYVYKLNYKANNASDIKVLIDGIALEPNMDYSVNAQNKYEIFLPKGIKYGTIISVYYLVANNEYFTPVVANTFGVGDISNLSFLEFIELIQRRMINARNRKTITDFKGGWYPTLLNVYVQYLKRGLLSDDDPLQSNGYTFQNLYSFLSKYNAFFQKFVDQLLSATIIIKQGGLLVRNSVFTKQKFAYKRGVNVPSNGRILLQYFGDGGSVFLVDQNYYEPAPPTAVIPVLTTGDANFITQTDAIILGNNISSDGGSPVTERGVVYDTSPNPLYGGNKTSNGTGTGTYASPLFPLVAGTQYYFRAYAVNGVGLAYGDEKDFTTQAVPVVPSLQTKPHTSVTTTSIVGTGGQTILPIDIWLSIDFYFMQYKKSTGSTWSQTSPSAGPLAVDNFSYSFGGLTSDTNYDYRAVMVVSGTPYYGNVLTVRTSAIVPVLPTVTTDIVTAITPTGATGGGNVTSAGTQPVTERGIVWGLAANPTTANNKIQSGSGTGAFTNCLITGLAPNTTYHVRAYAISAVGTAYGVDRTFTTTSNPVEVFFSSIVSEAPRIAANNLNSQTLSITIGYLLTAGCDVIRLSPGEQSSAITTLEVSLNGGSTWTTIDSVDVQCQVQPGDTDASDYDQVQGNYVLNGITAANIGSIRFRANYNCSSTQLGATGSVTITIDSVTINVGTANVICNNLFDIGCYSSGYLGCNL